LWSVTFAHITQTKRVRVHEGQILVPDVLLAHMAARGLSKNDMPECYIRLDTLPL